MNLKHHCALKIIKYTDNILYIKRKMLKVDWNNLFIATVIFNCLLKSKIFRVEGKFLINLIGIIVAVKN